MKQFSNYQHVDGEIMNERDKQEVGSKFWNKGKWDNFVLPFLPKDCNGLTLIDMGCNAGLFLKLAEDKGFSKIIGIDRNKEAFRRAVSYRERNGGSYELRRHYFERCLDQLPVSDYTILANAHYYFSINCWFDYLDRLALKTQYCIIVTAAKREKICNASAKTVDIKKYFKYWDETGNVPELSLKDDPYPRTQWSFCFKSPLIERVSMDSLNANNEFRNDYFKELDQGVDPLKTCYYEFTKERRVTWPERTIIKYILDKAILYEDIKKNGLLHPIIVNSDNNVIDGNHRYGIMKHLGYKSIFIRKT